MLVKIEARILIFPGTDFHFPSTSMLPRTFFRLCLSPRHTHTSFWQQQLVQVHVSWAVLRSRGRRSDPSSARRCNDTHTYYYLVFHHPLTLSFQAYNLLSCKSFRPQPFLFLLRDSLHGFPGLFTVTSEHICLYFLVFLFLHFLVVGSVRQNKLTRVGYRAHVKIASRIISYRMGKLSRITKQYNLVPVTWR